ncbi:hypothetical protein L9F63_026486, partial [Diploptera punctata]
NNEEEIVEAFATSPQKINNERRKGESQNAIQTLRWPRERKIMKASDYICSGGGRPMKMDDGTMLFKPGTKHIHSGDRIITMSCTVLLNRQRKNKHYIYAGNEVPPIARDSTIAYKCK